MDNRSIQLVVVAAHNSPHRTLILFYRTASTGTGRNYIANCDCSGKLIFGDMRGSRTRKKNSAPRLVAGELSVQFIERTLQYRRFKAKHFSDATKTVACSDVKSETFPKTVRRLVVKDRSGLVCAATGSCQKAYSTRDDSACLPSHFAFVVYISTLEI